MHHRANLSVSDGKLGSNYIDANSYLPRKMSI